VKSARGSWRVAIVVILAFAGCGRTEAGEPSDADVDGPETCQPPQQGVTCLAPPPDGATCVPLGQVYDARQPYQECCAGLSPISPNLEPASWCDANCITYGGTLSASRHYSTRLGCVLHVVTTCVTSTTERMPATVPRTAAAFSTQVVRIRRAGTRTLRSEFLCPPATVQSQACVSAFRCGASASRSDRTSLPRGP